jgi:hypothetical protein
MASHPAERVWRQLEGAPRAALEHDLSQADLQTLLLDVASQRAAAVTPARLMRRWRQDRYVMPSASDPRKVWRTEARLWALLPEEFTGVELSPVTPLGTCAALGPVSQNRVISTIRGSEVVSDPTNVLAVEAAWRRGKRHPEKTPCTWPAVSRCCAPSRSTRRAPSSTSGCSPWSPALGTADRRRPRRRCSSPT